MKSEIATASLNWSRKCLEFLDLLSFYFPLSFRKSGQNSLLKTFQLLVFDSQVGYVKWWGTHNKLVKVYLKSHAFEVDHWEKGPLLQPPESVVV